MQVDHLALTSWLAVDARMSCVGRADSGGLCLVLGIWLAQLFEALRCAGARENDGIPEAMLSICCVSYTGRLHWRPGLGDNLFLTSDL